MLNQVDTLIAFALVMALMSLLIMVVVQIVQVVWKRRGRNLRWGVELLFVQLGLPRDRATKLAQAVLTHPAVATNGDELAEAISVDELIEVVREVARGPRGTAAAEGTDARDARDLLAALAEAALESDRAEQIQQELQAGLDTTLREALDATSVARERFVTWFDMIMRRTTERFVARTRIITIGVAFALCFVLRIDAIAILQELGTNAEVRAALVAQAESSIDTLGERLDLTERSSDVARESLYAVLDDDSVGDDVEGAAEARESLRASLDAASEGPALRAELEQWIGERIDDPAFISHIPDAEARERFRRSLVASFADQVGRDLAETEKDLTRVAGELRSEIEGLDLDLFRAFDDRAFAWDRGWSLLHLAGVLAAALLLSLGAPFWFNMLQKLSNLRPTIARHVDDAAEPKAG